MCNCMQALCTIRSRFQGTNAGNDTTCPFQLTVHEHRSTPQWRAEKQRGLTHKYWVYPPNFKKLLQELLNFKIFKTFGHMHIGHCMFFTSFLRPFQEVFNFGMVNYASEPFKSVTEQNVARPLCAGLHSSPSASPHSSWLSHGTWPHQSCHTVHDAHRAAMKSIKFNSEVDFK